MRVNFMEWLKAAGIRAIRTVAQAAIAAIGTTAVFTDVNWAVVVSTALLAGVLSLLTSLAGLPEVKEESEKETEEKYIEGTKK